MGNVVPIIAKKDKRRHILLSYLYSSAFPKAQALIPIIKPWRIMNYLPALVVKHHRSRYNPISSGTHLGIIPNVVLQTQAAATSIINSVGFVVGTVTFQGSSSVLPGLVISQSPPAGSQAILGTPVNLVVSTGPGVNFVLLNTAITLATQAGLNVMRPVMWVYSSTVPYGYVIAQNPAAGTTVPLGTNTYLTASDGPAPPPKPFPNIPNVLGMARFDAEALIEDNGCNVNPVYVFANSNVYAQGLVMAQSPGPSSPVPAGTVVTLTISLGISITYYGGGSVVVPLMH